MCFKPIIEKIRGDALEVATLEVDMGHFRPRYEFTGRAARRRGLKQDAQWKTEDEWRDGAGDRGGASEVVGCGRYHYREC